MKYLLTGGGTGGHVYPALALADEIAERQHSASFLYVGLANKLESWVVPKRGFPIRFVRSRACPRSTSLWSWLGFSATLAVGILQASLILLRYRPHLIISTGGYVSAPIMFAHGILKTIGCSRSKVFIFEPNAHPGMLNQAAGRMADRIGVAFEQAGRWFDMRRVAVVGYPVRRELLASDRAGARRRFDIPPDVPVVLAFGGSGGARAINEAVIDSLPHLLSRPGLHLIHITGQYRGADYDAVADTNARLEVSSLAAEALERYHRFTYMETIQDAYAAADLVVCRGGMSTLTEIGICGLPAVIIPLPSAAEDHQAMNAREMERAGAAMVIYEEASWREGEIFSRVDGKRLASKIIALVDDREKRAAMSKAAGKLPHKNSLDLMLVEIENLIEGRRPAPLTLEFPVRAKSVPEEPNALLRWVRQRIDDNEDVTQLDPRELAYLRHHADRLLVSTAWYETPLGRRNVGIKLVGYLRYAEHVPLLLNILGDRSRVGLLKRLCGGDYIHGGFLRRNAIEFGIRKLGAADVSVKEALINALREDPYFEVRAMAARALGEFMDPCKELEQCLVDALDDPYPEVVIEVIGALGAIARHALVLEHLRRFYLHDSWQIRQRVVAVLGQLLERRLVDVDEVANSAEQILKTSQFFKPHFPLKQQLDSLFRQLERASAGREDRRQAAEQ
jgi:UDP-N-acetylglucosamine--N-acetylmuramyl-(pentapeptide) pyrophosphoryl-undecaprenol N-acetylglucosamine transferase